MGSELPVHKLLGKRGERVGREGLRTAIVFDFTTGLVGLDAEEDVGFGLGRLEAIVAKLVGHVRQLRHGNR